MSYALSAWIFIRALGLIYAVAFLSLGLEARGLWGARGVLPVAEYLAATPGPVVTLFRAGQGDWWLVAAAGVGVTAGLLAAAGLATGAMFLVCFVLYLSFVNVGQDFLSFQWDHLLLEVGALALFAVPWRLGSTWGQAIEPHWLVRGAFCFVLFKLMFLSGVVKLLSGDPAWRDLTALKYHYWTQPLPNPLSPFVHALPGWAHRAATLGTFVVELGLPFLILWPAARLGAGLGFGALSLFILATGNYTFFNWLTLGLSLWLVPDAWWGAVGSGLVVTAAPARPGWLTAIPVAALYVANLGWCVRYFAPAALNRAFTPLLSVMQEAHVSNSYGLFATMTKTRPEIVIEGSADGQVWREYVFNHKPGPVDRRPPVIAPLQPRLDWQMWFAALGTFRQNPFVGGLMARLFEGGPEVLTFFRENPFPDEPPRFLRARLYAYEFTAPAEIWRDGTWWHRHPIGDYSPTFQR